MAARVRLCRGRVWPCRGQAPQPCRSTRLPYRSVPRAPLRAVPRAMPCVDPCRAAHLPNALHASTCAPSLQSQYNPIVLRYKLSPASLLYCNTIASPSNCIAIHLPPRPATSLSQYTLLYCDTISLNQTSHLLQYTQLYCNANSSLPSQHC